MTAYTISVWIKLANKAFEMNADPELRELMHLADYVTLAAIILLLTPPIIAYANRGNNTSPCRRYLQRFWYSFPFAAVLFISVLLLPMWAMQIRIKSNNYSPEPWLYNNMWAFIPLNLIAVLIYTYSGIQIVNLVICKISNRIR